MDKPLLETVSFRIVIVGLILFILCFITTIISFISSLMGNNVIEDYYLLLNIFPILYIIFSTFNTPNKAQSDYLRQSLYVMAFFIFNFLLFFILLNTSIDSSFTQFMFKKIPNLMLDFSPTILLSLYLLYRYYSYSI